MKLLQQEKQSVYWTSVPSTMGECVVIATKNGICWLGTPGRSLDEGLLRLRKYMNIDTVVADSKIAPLKIATDELKRYFSNQKVDFSFPLDLHGTPFQKEVWHELQKIPFGKICTYGDIAKMINHPLASRAVGSALRSNPVLIRVPCHRVIGSNKKLTGFAGGLHIKKWLLTLEGNQI